MPERLTPVSRPSASRAFKARRGRAPTSSDPRTATGQPVTSEVGDRTQRSPADAVRLLASARRAAVPMLALVLLGVMLAPAALQAAQRRDVAALKAPSSEPRGVAALAPCYPGLPEPTPTPGPDAHP